MVKLMKSYVFPTNYMDAVGCGQMRLDVVFSLNRRNHIMNNSMRQADRVVNIPSLSASFNYNLQKIVAKWNKDDEGSNA